MLGNYLRLALRNLLKHKLYTVINILGLAIGLVCCMLIVLFVSDELQYDRYHDNAPRIYRVLEDIYINGVTENSASCPFPVATQMQAEFPDIEATVRFFRPTTTPIVKRGDERFREKSLFFADSSVFDVFGFTFLKGDPGTALDDPFTIVLTESLARKYFGEEEALGQMLEFVTGGPQSTAKVTGVIADVPHNSHFSFSGLISMATARVFVGNQTFTQQWWWNPCWTYILLPENFPPGRLEEQFPGFVEKYFPENIRDGISLSLQPLTDIHLHSQRDLEIQPNSDISYVYIFSAVALFILLIACINFMNLATARSARRAREVGVRKVMGAQRRQLIVQFLGESILIALLAVLLSAATCDLLLPFFNDFTGKELSVSWLTDWRMLLMLLGLGLVVGTAAGIYPAFFLSSFRPVRVLKGNVSLGMRSGVLRKVLVTIQFATSIGLLIAAAIVLQQMDYVRQKNLGFDREHIVLIKSEPPLFRRTEAFKQALLRHASVSGMTTMTETIGTGVQIRQYFPEGLSQAEPTALAGLGVDMDFLDVMNIDVVQGRGFSREHPSDTLQAYLLNETAARKLGWDEPIGKQFGMWLGPNFTRKGRIIGVVSDFNYASLRHPVESLVIFVFPFINEIAIKLHPGQLEDGIAAIEQEFQQFCPGIPFDYRFLDSSIENLYRDESRLSELISLFSLLAIFVACLGLFGLASFTVEQRVKEIGIRKTLGASVLNIVLLLSKEFSRLVVLAALVAIPIAWYAMDNWLQDFTYRINIGWEPFVLATLVALAVAIATVSIKTIRAALADPVKALSYE